MRTLLVKHLPWALLACLAAYVAVLTLFLPDYFEDSRYNLGVVRHTALPGARCLLETSCVHVFYEKYAIPRPEDWHRGLSLVMLSQWARLGPASSDLFMRLPHLAWVAAWLSAALLLFYGLRAPGEAQDGGAPPRVPFAWGAAVVGGALVLNPWVVDVLSRAYLDDVPSATCVLFAFVILVRAASLRAPAVAAAGVLCGLGFCMKDFCLLWGPLGALTVAAMGVAQRGWRSFREVAWGVAFFAAGFLLAAFPKFLWTWHDLGGPIKNVSLYWLIGNFYATAPRDTHYPYFLYGDHRYVSRIAVAGSLKQALVNVISRAGVSCKRAFVDMSYLALPFLPVVFAPKSQARWNPRERGLLVAGIVAAAGYFAFFGLGLGDAIQYRYWLVPTTLIAVVGAKKLLDVIQACGGLDRWAGLARVGLFGLFFFFLYSRPHLIVDRLGHGDPAPLTSQMLAELAAKMGSQDAALLGTRGGIYFSSLYPRERVVAFPTLHFPSLDPAAAARLFDAYGIRFALLTHEPSIEHIKTLGFVEIDRRGPDVLLERRAPAP